MNRPAPASLQFSLTLPRSQTHHLRFTRTDAANMPLRDTASTIESGLTAAFAFLAPASASWALSYLLDLSPPNALATLSSPPSTSAAVAALCVETTFEVASIGTTPTSPNSFISPRGAFDASLTFDGLFVPAFSANGITVGVVVNRLGPAPLPPISHSTTAPIHFAVGRYARSNVTGELLAVKRSATMPGIAPGPTPGLATIPSVEIIHLHLRGPCRRARATYVIEEAAWAAGIRPGAASGVDIPALSQAVSMVLRCEETRHCARCGAPAAAACGCGLAVAAPRNALDFAGHAAAFGMHSGEFIGTAEVVFRRGIRRIAGVACIYDGAAEAEAARGWDGGYVVSPRMVSRMCVNGLAAGVGGDPSAFQLAELLKDFAVQFSIAEQAPLGFIMPAVGGGGDGGEAGGECGRPVGIEGDVPTGDSESGCGIGGGIGAVSVTMNGTASCSGTLSEQRLLEFSEGLLLSEAAGVARADDFLPLPPDLAAPEDAALLHEYNLLAESILPPPPATAMSVDGPFPNPFLESTPPTEVVVCAGASGTSPEPQSAVGDSPGNGSWLRRRQRPVTEAERLDRARERRERNRAAATRANARRKLVNDSLKEGINQARQKVTMLRVRQAELYAANQELRLQLQRADILLELSCRGVRGVRGNEYVG
jgi:hypothetical protein